MQKRKNRGKILCLYLVVRCFKILGSALLCFLHLGKALAAVNGTVSLGLEGNLCFLSAGCASRSEELSRTVALLFTLVAAFLAALRLILEASLGIELLLSCCEYEFSSAFFADQCFVFVHFATSLFRFAVMFICEQVIFPAVAGFVNTS